MENSDIPIDYSKKKLIIVLITVGFICLTAPLTIFFKETLQIGQIIVIAKTICLGFLIFAWCYYDSLEINQPLSGIWKLVILLLGLLGLLAYLFKTRGIKKGLISIGILLLITIIVFIGSAIAIFIAILISGKGI